MTLPEEFEYFGQSFSHVYVNENGFLTFGNGAQDSDLPWKNVVLDGSSDTNNQHPSIGGGRH